MPRILIIDDSGFARSRLRRVLESRQHQVFEAADSHSGIALARQLQPDLITLDLLMPEMTGQEVLAQLKPELPRTRFVVISADVQELVRAEVLAAGADAFLNKPIQAGEVVATVDRLVAEAPPSGPSPRPHPLVLIVDDSSFARIQLRRVLEGGGYQVFEAASGNIGLPLALELQPDLITLDLLMPGMSGQEVLQVLKPQLPHTRFLVLTADVQEFTRQEVVAAGADAFLTKPFKPAEVLDAAALLLRAAS